MSALYDAKRMIEDAHHDEHGNQAVLAQLATAYAAIATAEQLQRIADTLERAYPATQVDDFQKNSIPGESWVEYQQRISR